MSLIAIYDSGVGGLSIYQTIVDYCPGHEIVFVSDNEAFPYGTKPEPELVQRVTKVVTQIAEHFAPDILVIACNTASTVVLPSLRARFEFDIVGVVPAIKPAAEQSKTKCIGLLATPATIQRAYTENLITEFASDCQVTKVGSSDLVCLVEEKLSGGNIAPSRIEAVLEPILSDNRIDTLILACTHFPLLNNEINSLFQANSRHVKLIDSSKGIAKRVSFLLHSNESTDELSEAKNEQATAVFTQPLNAPALFKALENFGFSSIDVLAI